MKHFAEMATMLLVCLPWLAGIVLAHGFVSTVAAVCVPPYAWYLVVERMMIINGWLV